jgi:hypothetical protein
MVQKFGLIEANINERTLWVRPVGSWVPESNNAVAEGLAASFDNRLEWAIVFCLTSPSTRPPQ